ncbi:endo-1,4-beta-xylanase [Larkinella rosea]|uniref:1,4-beta-xylanase n=1 Tax=Larkinella rosea TaxID=2025312 RepID=A0A3P1BGQ7_9BACT|nr:endo-1,4-beta-xylanase [Larkinella rosea]RRB00053.1 1,4-beta-xylanase [Larkinella rosea]
MNQLRLVRRLTLAVLLSASSFWAIAQQWTPKQANDWYKSQPWLVGSNFLPASAINQLEMWQAQSFDPKRIDKELGYAESLGMNTMRVFLHDMVWRQDAKGFKNRIDQFLALCAKHKIRPMLVLFDSCWDPQPKLGKQHAPVLGRHNSGWVQGPGAAILSDKTKWESLRSYVKDVVGTFRADKRILAWDIVNEPDNENSNSYGKNGKIKTELPNKAQLGVELVKAGFGWAREAKPTQPITSGPWKGDWSSLEKMDEMNKFLVQNSDVITFHNYGPPAEFQKRVNELKKFGRPLICTEYMARPAGSTFEGSLPIAKTEHVGMINWGFVSGKSNTIYPWDSWQKQYTAEPPVWFHDIFRENGQPYIAAETTFIRKMTGKK